MLLSPSGYEEYFEEIAAHLGAAGAIRGPDVLERMVARYSTRLAEPLTDDADRP